MGSAFSISRIVPFFSVFFVAVLCRHVLLVSCFMMLVFVFVFVFVLVLMLM